MRVDKNGWGDGIEEILGRMCFEGWDRWWMNESYEGS